MMANLGELQCFSSPCIQHVTYLRLCCTHYPHHLHEPTLFRIHTFSGIFHGYLAYNEEAHKALLLKKKASTPAKEKKRK